MFKKSVTLIAALALSFSLAGSAFAAFENVHLIRVISDATAGSTLEIATDLGDITVLAGVTNTKKGDAGDAFTNFIGSSPLSNLSVNYYAVNRTNSLNGTMYIGIDTPTAPVTAGLPAIQNKLSITSLNGPPQPVSVNKYYSTLATATGSTSTVIANNTNASSFGSTFGSTTLGGYSGYTGLLSSSANLSLIDLMTKPVAMTVWSFGPGNMAAQYTGVKILDLTTNADGSTTINPTYTVTASAGANGSLTTGTTPQTVALNATSSFTFDANTGYYVASITGCNGTAYTNTVSTVTSHTYTTGPVTADCTVSATFALAPAVTTYTVDFIPGGNGTITGSASQTVNSGAAATAVTAVPAIGYHFVNWTGSGATVISTNSTLTVSNVTAAQTITANFAIDTFTVTFTSDANGTLTGTASQTVNYGASATVVTAVPATGYHFVNWTGTGGFVTTTANPLTVTGVTANQSITANFAITSYALTFAAGANGTLNGPTAQTVNYGAAATAVTAVPNIGYHFVNWTGTGGFVTTATNPLTVTTVSADQSITANFAIDSFTVTPSIGIGAGNGSITPLTAQSVNYNGTASFTVTPTGSYSASVSGTCGGSLVGTTYNTNPITAHCTVIANFSQTNHTVTASAGINGAVAPATQPVSDGASATITIKPDTGYNIATVSGCGGTLTGTSYSTAPVTADCSVNATFSIKTFALTFASGGNGSLTGTTSQTINYGATTTELTAVPAANFHFVNWTGTGGFVTTIANPLTVSNVTAAQTITANFAIDALPVTFINGGNGSLTGSASQNVSYGAAASPVTAVPAAHYHFVNWTGGGGFVTTIANPLTLLNVTTAQTITANFALDTVTVTFSSGINGSVSGTASQNVNYGASATAVSAMPNTGYHFVNWTGTGGFLTSSSNPLTVANVTAAQNITANFAIDTYTLSFVSGSNGTLTGAASQTVNYGASASAVTAVPASGYYFVNWSDGASFISSSNPLTLSNVTAAQTITANFAPLPPIQFTVAPVSGPHGSISPSVNQGVEAGKTAVFTITPDSGYQISSVSGCGGKISGSSFSTAGILGNCTVSATFIAIPAVKGDLNGDGTVNVADALLALQFAIGLKKATPAELASGDVAPFVNGTSTPDGIIDIADAVAVLQKSIGLFNW
ncbi:MAG TPA: hypothetical protein HPP97_13440 [Desulfuromonadales bacterium]|nr:hypothetical protein [Desulfuromonadales bacterium]